MNINGIDIKKSDENTVICKITSFTNELKQIISISMSQNKRDKIISDFERQKTYFIKIKELLLIIVIYSCL